MGFGGAEGNRTPDLDVANVALSQLSYGPGAEYPGVIYGRRHGPVKQAQARV